MGYGDVYYGECQYKGACAVSPDFPPITNKINPTTGKCYQYAVKDKEQGQGFVEWRNGENMLWPERCMDSVRITDTRENYIHLMWDELMGRPYRIGTRDGPTGSGITKAWKDKQAADGTGGTEIPTTTRLLKHTGSEKSRKLEHIKTNTKFEPQDVANAGETGYDSDGFRDDFDATLKIFRANNVTESARINKLERKADATIDRKFEDDELTVQLETTTSEFKITDINTKYVEKNKARTDTENDLTPQKHQADLNNHQLLWVSRSMTPQLNLVTGLACGGSYTAVVTGPDGRSSGLSFVAGQGLTNTLSANIPADFSIIFSISNLTLPCDVLRIGDLTIQIYEGANKLIRFNDGTHNITQVLAWDGTGWGILGLVRSGANLLIYEAGSLLLTAALAPVITYGTNVRIMSNQIGSIADVRINQSVLSADVHEYYYRDITENEGRNVLSEW
jgi:hypothetical protein